MMNRPKEVTKQLKNMESSNSTTTNCEFDMEFVHRLSYDFLEEEISAGNVEK